MVTPSNPKTVSQTVQRSIMKTVVKAYAFMKEIVDHSFEGQEYGRKSMSFFNQQNAILARQKIADMQNDGLTFYQMFNFMPKTGPEFLPNQYLIAMGSLPQLRYAVDTDNPSRWGRLSVGAPAGALYTYEEVINGLGLRRGDQLTFVLIEDRTQAGMSPQFEFHYARVVLDPIDPETHLQVALSTPFFAAGQGGYNTINCPSPRNQAAGRMLFSQGQTTIDFQKSMNNTVVACAVIASRKDGNKWMRSTQYLAYNGGSYQPYSLGHAMDSFADNAGSDTPLYMADPYYLNNAGEGGSTAAVTGADNQAGTGTGGNNQQASAPVISRATLSETDGAGQVSLVAGSTKSITKEADFATLNCDLEVVGTYPNGATIKIKKVSDQSQVGDTETFDDGAAMISPATLAKGVVYELYVNDVATGMKFSVTYNDNGLLNEG